MLHKSESIEAPSEVRTHYSVVKTSLLTIIPRYPDGRTYYPERKFNVKDSEFNAFSLHFHVNKSHTHLIITAF